MVAHFVDLLQLLVVDRGQEAIGVCVLGHRKDCQHLVHEHLAVVLLQLALHELEDFSELLVLAYLGEFVVGLQHELVQDLFVLHKRAISHQVCSLNQAKRRDFVNVILDQGPLDWEQVQLVRQKWICFVMDRTDGGQGANPVHISFG